MIVAVFILLLFAIAIGTAADSGKVLAPPVTHGPVNGGSGIPGSVRHYSGTPQFAAVGTAYSSLLVARVSDSLGDPVPGISVTFTAPSTGPSGAFMPCTDGNVNWGACTVTTNAAGLAAASAYTANSTPGAYSVTAMVARLGTPATFSLVNTADFTISGDVTTGFLPGTSQKVDLVFTNPNPSPITVASGAVAITISSPLAECSASANFAVKQGLTSSVTVPANSTESLADLGVAQGYWPVITMVETHTNQDACKGVLLTLLYSGSSVG
jgi:hypothetical protein